MPDLSEYHMRSVSAISHPYHYGVWLASQMKEL